MLFILFVILFVFATPVLCDYKKMVDEQSRYILGRITEHTSLYREKSKLLQVAKELSRDAEELFTYDQVSIAHNKAPTAPFNPLSWCTCTLPTFYRRTCYYHTWWFSWRYIWQVTTSSLYTPQ